jgi:tRNA (guanosine-2'-O-)-methyltransferase
MNAPGKSITPRRLARMRGTLARRQPDMAVVLENVNDPHNVSACLRTCDAVGASAAHLLYWVEEFPQLSSGVAASANRWLDVQRHATVDACYDELHQQGVTIYATALTGESHNLYELDLTQPSAFVFGNESRGVSSDAIAGADATVFIPMMGMVESLNVSVACAVTLYEALRQRLAAGLYDAARWTDEELESRLRAWLEREGRDPGSTASRELDEIPRARNRYQRGGS